MNREVSFKCATQKQVFSFSCTIDANSILLHPTTTAFTIQLGTIIINCTVDHCPFCFLFRLLSLKREFRSKAVNLIEGLGRITRLSAT